MILPASAFAHKLIPTDGSNNDIVSALEIPDPIVSWAMYEELSNNVLYYKFDAKKGDKLSASIVIPKLDGLEDFSPSLAFIAPSFTINLISELKVLDSTKSFPFPIPDGYDAIVFDYNGKLPSKESYEPFGQITYWERQEIDLVVPVDGTYYLAVYDSSGDYGKLALAIGYVEDFSAIDFMTVLPYAWFESRYFVEDYVTPVIASLVAIGLILGVVFLIYKRIRHKSKS
jgi:hypothetical protein